MNNKNSHLYNNLLYVEMRKYGIDNFRFSILCYTNNEDILYDLEDYFIRKYNTIVDSGKGYNYNYGGLNGLHSEETKNKLSRLNFQSGKDNISYGKIGKDSFSGKRVMNVSQNKIYNTLKECALEEYGDEKFTKQISKVCNPHTNYFTYKKNIYRLLDENNNIIEKNTQCIKNSGSKGVPVIETFSNNVFESIEKCAKYFHLSTGVVRDRVYKRIKNDKYKNLYNFELLNNKKC